MNARRSCVSGFPTQLLPIVFGLALLVLSSSAAEDSRPRTGKDLAGWKRPTGEWFIAGGVALDPADASKFRIQPGTGVLVNGPKSRTVDLLSEPEFGDVQVHIEFCLPQHSNSGVYLMGRYEVQIYDSYGVSKDQYPGIECGGIYPRWTSARAEYEGHSPRVNVSKPAGEWQSFDITFRAPRFDGAGRKTANAKFVKVVQNGTVVHENVEVTGPTRAAHWETETPTGPLLLQGDHGPIAYRNLRIESVRLE